MVFLTLRLAIPAWNRTLTKLFASAARSKTPSLVAAEVTRLKSLWNNREESEPPYVGCYFFDGLLGAVLVAFLMFARPGSAAEIAASKEYQVKAIFLFNFAQFVEWPTNAFPGPQSALIIGVLGDDPFGDYLDEAVRGEQVNGRPLEIQRYRQVDEIRQCHVLFISRSESGRLHRILTGLSGRNILTVGDVENLAFNGGMIRFITEKNKIRLRVNIEAARAANLTISSKLLRPADIIGPANR
jgi:hypothetical protein